MSNKAAVSRLENIRVMAFVIGYLAAMFLTSLAYIALPKGKQGGRLRKFKDQMGDFLDGYGY